MHLGTLGSVGRTDRRTARFDRMQSVACDVDERLAADGMQFVCVAVDRCLRPSPLTTSGRESLALRIGRTEVSRACEALDEHVEAFRTRPLI